MSKLVRTLLQERKKNESRLQGDMERLRVKYIAREEKYLLDGDREELYAIKRELDSLKYSKVAGSIPTYIEQPEPEKRMVQKKIPAQEHSHSEEKSSFPEKPPPPSSEMERLVREKKELLQSNMYTKESFLIQELDRRIQHEMSQ